MKRTPVANSSSCQCGAVQIDILAAPVFRTYCHCTICQEYNKAPFADVCAFYSNDVVIKDEQAIGFKVYQSPPLVHRGTCMNCECSVAEKIHIPLMPRLVVIPTLNIVDKTSLPESSMHGFYHRRLADFNDDLPKHTTVMASQLAFSGALMKAMYRRRPGKEKPES